MSKPGAELSQDFFFFRWLPQASSETLGVLFKASMATNTYFTLFLCLDEVSHFLAIMKIAH